MSNRLNYLEKTVQAKGWRYSAAFIICAIAALVGWATFAKLEEVAVANGAVVPQGQIKVIQHSLPIKVLVITKTVSCMLTK